MKRSRARIAVDPADVILAVTAVVVIVVVITVIVAAAIANHAGKYHARKILFHCLCQAHEDGRELPALYHHIAALR